MFAVFSSWETGMHTSTLFQISAFTQIYSHDVYGGMIPNNNNIMTDRCKNDNTYPFDTFIRECKEDDKITFNPKKIGKQL